MLFSNCRFCWRTHPADASRSVRVSAGPRKAVGSNSAHAVACMARSASVVEVPGLKNEGNTCFFAATLQALASSKLFTARLDAAVSRLPGIELPISRRLRALLLSLQPSTESKPSLAVTDLLRELRKGLPHGSLDPGRQHDAVEAYELLAAATADELSTAFAEIHSLKSSLADVLPHRRREQQSLEASRMASDWPTPSLASRGSLLQQMQCSHCGCKFTSQTWAFRLLSVMPMAPGVVGISGRHASVLTALDTACRGIELVDDVECSWCSFKCSVRAAGLLQTQREPSSHSPLLQCEMEAALVAVRYPTKQPLDTIVLKGLAQAAGLEWCAQRCRVARTSLIANCPEVLALHIKRGFWTAGRYLKLDGHASFLDTFDLLPFTVQGQAEFQQPCLVSAPESAAAAEHGELPSTHLPATPGSPPGELQNTRARNLIYELRAVVVHSGLDGHGHYHVFRKISRGACEAGMAETSDIWLSISDTKVRQATAAEVFGCEASLLIYDKVLKAP